MLEQIFSSASAETFNINLNGSINGCKFSEFFPLLFAGAPGNDARRNLFSYLSAICDLENLQLGSEEEDRNAATRILGILGRLEVIGVHPLVSYLIMVHRTTYVVPEARPNIFKFMTHFPIEETKVVFMFHTPSGANQSCGHALHGAVTETSKLVFDRLNEELRLVSRFLMNNEESILTPEQLEEYKENCKFDGWIRQGVLLLNAYLTYNGAVWDEFTDKLVQVVSELQGDGTRKVFLLSSGEAGVKGKRNIIDEKNHMIIQLYHPTNPIQTNTGLMWNYVFPFINTNFFIYQASNGNVEALLDWTCIAETDTINDARSESLRGLFDEALRQNEITIQMGNENYIVLETQFKNGYYKLLKR